MKKVLLFVAVISVVSLASCKKKTCTYTSGGYTYTDCTKCSGPQVKAAEAAGYTCK
ncbi:MAG TPA: hypothetical protein VNW06_06670 [Cytophagaceae bacterium]|jgi:hypothetical protein|nr:hypothetical protein [Cytophagaceae bacterium]